MMENETKCGLVALCGLPNAGKSTLLNALVGAKLAAVSPRPETTRRQIRGVITEENTQFVFVDMPGFSRLEQGLRNFMAKQIHQAVSNVNVIAWITDASKADGHGFEREVERFRQFLKVASSDIPFVLILNKIDEVKNKEELLPLIEKWKDVADFKEVVPVSAKKSVGLDRLKAVFSTFLPSQPFFFEKDALTDASEREIVSELVRESAIRLLSEELPYRIAVTVEAFDEERRTDGKKPLIDIQAVIHVERDSQKAIVIGKGGTKIREIGERARKSVESLLGVQVMLRLFVRVEDKWSTDTKSLRKLGYK